jgi:hypothetical protein
MYERMEWLYVRDPLVGSILTENFVVERHVPQYLRFFRCRSRPLVPAERTIVS